MDITHEQLDTPINAVEEGATNDETFREFITSSEEEFCMRPTDLYALSVEELNKHIEFLDYLWTK